MAPPTPPWNSFSACFLTTLDERPVRHRRWVPLLVVFAGTAAAVGGWFVDRAAEFPLVLRLIAEGPAAARGVLDRLESGDAPGGVSLDDPGARWLFDRWDWRIGIAHSFKERATRIHTGANRLIPGRTEFDVDLWLGVTAERDLADSMWSLRGARKLVDDEISRRVRWLGLAMLLGGAATALAGGLWEWTPRSRRQEHGAGNTEVSREVLEVDECSPPPFDSE